MDQIETKRLMLYEAYEKNAAYNEIIEISQELDDLLNQLETINQKSKVNSR